MDQIIDRIKTWGDLTTDFIGLIMVGSQTRIEKPADEWSKTPSPKQFSSENYMGTNSFILGQRELKEDNLITC